MVRVRPQAQLVDLCASASRWKTSEAALGRHDLRGAARRVSHRPLGAFGLRGGVARWAELASTRRHPGLYADILGAQLDSQS